VYVLNPRDDLLKELTGFGLLQPLSLNDIIKELAAPGILHDQEKLL